MKKVLCYLLVLLFIGGHLSLVAQNYPKAISFSKDYRISKTQIINYYQGEVIMQFERLYDYDNQGNLIEYKFRRLVDDIWSGREIIYYTYNQDNLLTEKQFGFKEFASHPWDISSKNLYLYDEHLRLIKREYYHKFDNKWDFRFHTTFDYFDGEKHTIEKLFSQSRPGIQHTIHCYYDDSLRLLERSKYTDNAIIPSERLLMKYDPNGKIIQTIEEDGGVTKEEFYYENDSLIRKETYKWTSEGWDIRERTLNTFDNIGNRISEKHQEYPSDGWDNKQLLENTYDDKHNLIEQLDYRWVNNEWDLRYHFFHDWELKNSLGINPDIQIPDNTAYILIFPNPTSGLINISGLNHAAEVKIYSIQGTLLKSMNRVENNIDISDLPGGVYILNLQSGDHRVFRKIVVKR